MNTKSKGIEFYGFVKRFGLTDKMSKYVTCQAAHETGGFTSFIYLANTNAFGMKYAGQATARGEKNGYAYYNSVVESINDWHRWYLRHNPWVFTIDGLVNISMFVDWLKRNNYFEADPAEYKRGMEHFYKTIFE